MTFTLPGMYHVGVVVDSLERSMEEMGGQLSLTWVAPQHRNLTVDFRGRVVNTDLRFTYSEQGPVHIELIESVPDTPWEPASMHHVGYWTDDLQATAREFDEAGMELDTTYDGPGPGPVGFGYWMGESGYRIEVVDGARRDAFEQWIKGGEFPAAPGN